WSAMRALSAWIRILVVLALRSARAIDFGYHPSAEEFDSLLRTSYGRDLLQRRVQETRRFVPRYQHETSVRFEPPELDFQLYEDRLETGQPYVFESVEDTDNSVADQLHIQSDILQVAKEPTRKPDTQDSPGNFPIYFTHPSTGIVYQISQVGQDSSPKPGQGQGQGLASSQSRNDSNSIAIYVTKAQYDADLELLRRQYEQQCQLPPPGTVISTLNPVKNDLKGGTTARPQIIRLKKPTSSGPKPNNKLPQKTQHRPPPVMVTSGPVDHVSDQLLKLPHRGGASTTTSTTRRPNTRRKKRKKKKQQKPKVVKKRPGYGQNNTRNQVGALPVFLGKRTTTTTTTTRPPAVDFTQLEKPHNPQATVPTGNVFSQHLFREGDREREEQEPGVLLNLEAEEHPREARSLDLGGGKKWLKKTLRKAVKGARKKLVKDEKNAEDNDHQTEENHARKRRSLEALAKGTVKVRLVEKEVKPAGARRVSTPRRRSSKGKKSSPGQRKAKPKLPATGTQKTETPSSGGHNLPIALHLLHRNHSREEDQPKDPLRSPASLKNRKTKDKANKTKTKARKRERPDAASAFDFLELISDGDYEDGEEEEDEDDEDYYEDIPKPTTSGTVEEDQNDRKEDSSSAEEGADFGAMVEEETTIPPSPNTSSEEDQDLGDATKNSMAKKRIRIKRRPVDSDEDYDDDDDSGIGGFFRMIFYPVQVAMSRLMDGFAGPEEDEEKEPERGPTITRYPTYTLYHSAHSNEAFAEDDEEEDESSSLGSWFGSWFGLQRRTKKSGTTTTTSSPPAKDPPGWLESWFGFGKNSNAEADSEDDYDKWFASWFESKPKRKVRRRSTTSTSTSTSTTTTTTPASQLPILTIVDPLRNPQNWIGILAHHIVNSTSTTTGNPLVQALANRMTSKSSTTTSTTTTSRPEVPRRISYDKFQIWRLKPQDEAQVRALEEFKKGEDGVKMHWLKGPSLRGLTDVLVAPKMLVDFQGTLNYEGIAHEVLIFDVGKAIAYERSKEDYLHTTRPSKLKPSVAGGSGVAPWMTWSRYQNHDEIVKYLELVRMKHPQLVELIHIGRSYEGRPLIVVKIESKDRSSLGDNPAQKRPKRRRKTGQANAVFVEAGAQGLAWIGPASATWMIAEILRLMKSNKTNEDMDFVRNTTWYVMPVLNPDGYAYSHEYDRFWRKSRSQHQAPPPSGILDSAMTWLQQKQRGPEKTCYGVDLDRNWLYHWGKRGSSKAPCNEFYAGPAPFSEPETKAVSDFLMDYRTQIKVASTPKSPLFCVIIIPPLVFQLYISLQAYGQVVSYPVKANSTFNSERLDDFLDVAMVGTDGLRKKGSKSRYKVDASNDLVEQRSGCADAFAAYEIGIPFAYTIQLADNGVHGYLLPSSAIEPTARDAFEIISGMVDYI
ncbi:hypothetical protein KR018_005294, partial [Drosophila ironensis]